MNRHGLSVIAPRRMEKKIHLRNGVICDDTPAPGRHYTRETWPPRKRGRGEELYSPRRIEAKLKARKAFDLYFKDGLTWPEIAAKLGYASKSGPWMAVRRQTTRNDHNSGYFQ